MVVTWTRVTNPPAAGNITLADDTEVDGSEGVVPHAGGWIYLNTYEFRVLEDASFTQSGGDICHSNTLGTIYQEPGSSLQFTGSDGTYTIYRTGNHYGTWIVEGTSAKHCKYGGVDVANRPKEFTPYLIDILWKYLDIEYMKSPGGSYYIYLSSSGIGLLDHVTTSNMGVPCPSRELVVHGGTLYQLTNCDFNSACNYSLEMYNGNLIIYNCSSNAVIRRFNASYGSVVRLFGDDACLNWYTGNPANYSVYKEGAVLFYSEVKLSSTPVDCKLVIEHPNPPDSISPIYCTDIKFVYLFGGGNDSESVFVLSKVLFASNGPSGNTWAYYSVSGMGGANNDQYDLYACKEGYRTEKTTLWVPTDQTWNVTLQPQADFDDIMDILGTPADFGSGDTIADNLKDLADDNGGADYDPATDSLEVISDKLTDVEALIDNMVVFGQITGPQHPVLDGSSSYYITMTDLTGAQIPSGAVTTAGSYMVMRWNSGTSTWDMIETDSLWAGDGVLTIDPVFSSVDWADGDIYMIMTDGLTIVTLDGDTFQKPGMVFYGMVGGDSTLTSINTKIGTPVSLDGGAATISGMLTKMADDNGGADYDATTDSLTSLSDTAQDILMDIGTGLDLGLKKPRPGARKG